MATFTASGTTASDAVASGTTASGDVARHLAAARRGPRRRRVLVIDDLVDTGRTARLVREMLPKAHYATLYSKPMGRPVVDTFITEVSQDTWIYFPWDMGLAFQPPIVG